MLFTRRLLDHRASALILAACSLPSLVVTSCSSDEETAAPPPVDGFDATLPDASDVVADVAAGQADHDAPAFDGGPRPVVCTSRHCAKSLTVPIRPTSSGTLPKHNGTWSPEAFCALLDDGTVACWGDNSVGQLGRGDDGRTTGASATPARVVGLSNVVELSHSCARTADGGVWCWGQGPYVEGDATVLSWEPTPVKMPVPPATHVAAGAMTACVTTNDGLVCWGANDFRQIETSSPSLLPPTRVDLPPGAPIRELAVGRATFLVREDGSTLSWGNNPPLARVSSLNPDPHPAPTVLHAVSSVDLVSTSACATSEGIGYCWGDVETDSPFANPGEVDYGNSEDYTPSPLLRALPEPVVAPEPLVQIATTDNVSAGYWDDEFWVREVLPRRWCAVGASGAVYCWGLNTRGQAGDGTKDAAFDTVKVEGLPAPAAEVRTMPLSTCALLTTGKVYCWGNNFCGQLGNGHIKAESLTPQEVVLP